MDSVWYSRNHLLALLLFPFSLVFGLVAAIRRLLYRIGVYRSHRAIAPVIVVGNITVGGTGKTPLVIWLAQHLMSLGYKPGIVSRGYGGKARSWPQQVRPDSDPHIVGDEAILLAGRTGCPVCVSPDRAEAVNALLTHTNCNIVISDDGLQHYAMSRDIEIAVIDGARGFGNGFLLPAGPLREKSARLKSVDLVVSNGQWRDDVLSMHLTEPMTLPLAGALSVTPLSAFYGHKVHAIAGTGHPQRFFDLLEQAGVPTVNHPFRDHYNYKLRDLVFDDNLPVLMTEKDGVKCRQFTLENAWVVGINIQPQDEFIQRLDELLEEL